MSPLAVFQRCRSRLERAESHRKAFAENWHNFIQDDPFDYTLNIDPSGEGVLLVRSRYFPLPDIFSFELGEILHQLRAALDASIYATAVQQTGQNPPPMATKLEFPICESPSRFKDNVWKIKTLSDYQQAIVEAVQPYNMPDDAPLDRIVDNVSRSLGILNDWARKDRHRGLRVVNSWVSNADPLFMPLPHGCEFAYIFITNDNFLEYEHVIAEFKINGFLPEMSNELQVNPNVTIDVTVNEPPIPCHDNDTLDHRIETMFFSVKTVIDTLEKSFNKHT